MVKAILVFLIAQQIDNNFVSPKILGSKVGLHPMVTLIAILAGGQLFGLVGMIFAAPITAILLLIYKKVYAVVKRPEDDSNTPDAIL
jgi:predicted PurR-regulated permease PerM